MPDDRNKSLHKKSNWDFNLPTHSKEQVVKEYSLFHCHTCGFHSSVICETRPIHESDLTQIRLVEILPTGQNITEIFGDTLPGDIQTCDSYICGKCGKAGSMENVPEFVLMMEGAIDMKQISSSLEDGEDCNE